MGSKRAWGSAIGTVIAPGIGTAAGYAIGNKMDRDDKKKKSKSGGGASAVSESEKSAEEKKNAEGGSDPFAETVAAKKKKVNTLITGSQAGALSGAGGTQGALTLGS